MAPLTLNHSVGMGGTNHTDDIRAVQIALNQLLSPAHIAPLSVDGSLGSDPDKAKTVAAIRYFQAQVVKMQTPDGRVDVNGKTHRTINRELAALTRNQPVQSVRSDVPWMTIAMAEMGQTEVPGPEANARILAYFKAAGFWGTDDSGGENAWCGSFVAWVMQQSGFTPVAQAYRAKEWRHFGRQIAQPVYGAIGIKSRQGGGHVAFVVGTSADGKSLYMLGGNQRDSVNIARYSRDVWDSFVVPDGFDETRVDLPLYSQHATAAGSEA